MRATGTAATLLKWVTDGEGDLVVTDVVMPDENVFDVPAAHPQAAAEAAGHRDERARTPC